MVSCDRCIGTDVVLEDVMAILTPSLELVGYGVAYRKTEITTAEISVQYEFLSSPTIRVNGQVIYLRKIQRKDLSVHLLPVSWPGFFLRHVPHQC